MIGHLIVVTDDTLLFDSFIEKIKRIDMGETELEYRLVIFLTILAYFFLVRTRFEKPKINSLNLLVFRSGYFEG